MSLDSHLQELKKKHTELDQQLKALKHNPSACSTVAAKIKKEKLYIKDQIQRLSKSSVETSTIHSGLGRILVFDQIHDGDMSPCIGRIPLAATVAE